MLMLKKISYINNKHVFLSITITTKIKFIYLCSYEKKNRAEHRSKISEYN